MPALPVQQPTQKIMGIYPCLRCIALLVGLPLQLLLHLLQLLHLLLLLQLLACSNYAQAETVARSIHQELSEFAERPSPTTIYNLGSFLFECSTNRGAF